MGCYMSSPDKRVYVSEGEGKNFIYATASCQGWRRDQEDAEECIPYFDENASLFILCDGHGGAEVAKYTVEHLPNFIKNHPLYKEGKYEEALEKAFLEFDALLRTDEVYQELHRLSIEVTPRKKSKKDSQTLDEEPSGSAGTSSSHNDNGMVDDDIDADTLRREAQLPLSSILEKYPAILALAEQSRASRVNASPVIRAPRDDENGEPGPSSSTSGDQEPTQGPSNLNTPIKPQVSKDAETSKPPVTLWPAENPDDSSDSDSGSDFFFKGGSSSDEDDNENDDGDDEGDNEAGEGTSSGPKKIRRKKHKRPLDDDDDDSDTSSIDDDDDDDLDSGSEEDESENDDDEEADEDFEQESGDDEEDDEEQWEDVPEAMRPNNRPHKPGMDSGCTVVVALVKDGKIYVASAGDSRCIMVMRNGECRPMSFDHKPEDAIERKRINKAGGIVTEGRVNGGLNLSRALGDFTYKNSELDAKDQMITACPDVKTADLDPKEVEYIFLACDGIWNSMKNQQAAKFIRRAAPKSKKDLVQLCVQLFRSCIAPQTDGDGTGCDNMTCIIAKYDNSLPENSTNDDLKKEVKEEHEAEAEGEATPSHKRSTSDDDEINDLPTKRRCLRL